MSPEDGSLSSEGHWYPISQVAKSTPYSPTFLRQLARQGKIDAVKIGRDWLTTQQAVLQYIQAQQERHKKALAILQTAERAFLVLTLILIVFSTIPKVDAQGPNTLPYSPGTPVEAVLNKVTAGWQGLASFYSQELTTIFNLNASSLAEQATQARLTVAVWHQFGSFYGQRLSDVYRVNASALAEQANQIKIALVCVGQAMLGKTPEEYLADPPGPDFTVGTYTMHSRGSLRSVAASALSEAGLQQPRVLGLSTGPTSAPAAKHSSSPNSGVSETQVQGLIDQILQQDIASGAFTGPNGPQGPPGASSSSVAENGNGETTALIGGNPIVTYVPPVPGTSFSGASLAGFTDLSAGSFTSGDASINGNFNVSGAVAAAGAVTAGSLTSSGNATIDGVLSAATSTLASLTVSGPATFTGSTTIVGLTVTGFNPGLTPGSIAFQGASGLVQDNLNLFYDSADHRLGLGTTTPSQLLTVAGNSLFTGQLAVTGPAAFGTTTIVNLTLGTALPVSGGGTNSTSSPSAGAIAYGTGTAYAFSAAGTANQVLASGGVGAPAFVNIASLISQGSNIVVSGTSTIAVSANPSFTSLNVSATSTLGNASSSALTVSGPLFVTGPSTLATASISSLTVNGHGISGTNSGDVTLSGQNYLSLSGQQITANPINLNSGNVNNLLQVSNGGTNSTSSPSAGAIVYGTGSAYAFSSPGTANQVLTSGGLGVPVFVNIASLLTQGSNIQVSGTSTLAVVSSPSFAGITVSGTSSMASLTTTGNVGIGTTTPNATLTLQGSGTADLLNITSSSGASDLYVTSAGNVGIGTTSPQYALDVNGNIEGSIIDDGGQVFNLTAFGAKCDGATDDTAALMSALTAVYNAHGGTIVVPSGKICLIAGQVTLPNDDTPHNQTTLQGPYSRQVYTRITGGQNQTYGDFIAPSANYGGALDFTYNGNSGSGAKLQSFGFGVLEIDHLTLESTGSSDTSALIWTTGTTLNIHDNELFSASDSNDAIVLGGTDPTFGDVLNSPSAAFQGYDAHIENNLIQGFKHAVLAQSWVQHAVITGNFFQSGGNSTGGRITFDDTLQPSNPEDCSNGGSNGNSDIENNRFEMKGYKYALELKCSIQNYFAGNDIEDPDGTTAGIVWLDANSDLNTIMINNSGGISGAPANDVTDLSNGDNLILNGAGDAAPNKIYGDLTINDGASGGSLTTNGSVTFTQPRAATANNNYPAPSVSIQGSYWNGSSAATTTWAWKQALNSGANPNDNLYLTYSGSPGAKTIDLLSSTSSLVQVYKLQAAQQVDASQGFQVNGVNLASTNLSDSNTLLRDPGNDFSQGSILMYGTSTPEYTTAISPMSVQSNNDVWLGFGKNYFTNSSADALTLAGLSLSNAYTLNNTYIGTSARIGLVGIGNDNRNGGSNAVGVLGIGNGGWQQAVGGRFAAQAYGPIPAYGVRSAVVSFAGGNGYGVYIDAGSGTGTNWGLYQSGPSDINYFAGNVGIGTTSPQYLLQAGNSSVSGIVARFQNANGTCDINPTTNTLACSSDERLKKNITPMTDDLNQVMALQPVYFNWNAESTGTPEHPGFIAQQVQAVMPDVVSADPNTGLMSIGYSDLVPAMVSAMQQMQTEITTLQGGLNGNASTSNLTVYDPSNFSGDSVGEAEIPPGQTSVRVNFSQQYAYQPIVTFSPEGSFVPAFISEKDDAGFTLSLVAATTAPTTFDWHSFASPSEQLTVSGGTTQPIALVVAGQSPPNSSGSGQATIFPAAVDQGASSSPSSGQVLADSTTTPGSSASTTPDSSGISTPDANANASSSPPSLDQSSGTQAPTPPPSDDGANPSLPGTVAPLTQPTLAPSTSSATGEDGSSETASPPSSAATAGGSATPPPSSTAATATTGPAVGSTSP